MAELATAEHAEAGVLYRIEGRGEGPDSYEATLYVHTYRIRRETPQGCWIDDGNWRKLERLCDGEVMECGIGAHQAWWVDDLPYDRAPARTGLSPGPFAVKATLDPRPVAPGMRSAGNPLVPQGIVGGLVRRR